MARPGNQRDHRRSSPGCLWWDWYLFRRPISLDNRGIPRWKWVVEVPRRASGSPSVSLCFCLLFNRSGSKRAFRLPGATWDHFLWTVEPSPGHIRCRLLETPIPQSPNALHRLSAWSSSSDHLTLVAKASSKLLWGQKPWESPSKKVLHEDLEGANPPQIRKTTLRELFLCSPQSALPKLPTGP